MQNQIFAPRGWPQQRQGIVPRGSAPMMDSLQSHLVTFEPKTVGQQVLFQEAYRQFNELVEARRARLDSVATGMPASLWWLVILGAIISITASLFFDMRSLSMHTWMTMLMSGFLGLMIFLIATLDNPFRGKVSISSQPLERVYQQIIH